MALSRNDLAEVRRIWRDEKTWLGSLPKSFGAICHRDAERLFLTAVDATDLIVDLCDRIETLLLITEENQDDLQW